MRNLMSTKNERDRLRAPSDAWVPMLLTSARDFTIASIKLKHVDLIEVCAHQDACEVKTKFGKTFPTYFFPVEHEIRQIVEDRDFYGNTSCGEMIWMSVSFIGRPLFVMTHVYYPLSPAYPKRPWT